MATQVKTDLIANNAITDAKIANVAITGVTASSGDSSTSLATTAFVAGEINSLIDAAPGALNTLNELAAALGDDANFSTTVTNSIATKLPLAGGDLTGRLTITGADPGNNVGRILDIFDSTAVAADVGGGISLYGKYQGSSYSVYAQIIGAKTNSTSGDYSGYLSFKTRPNNALPAERMRIVSDGRIGIGTNSPEDYVYGDVVIDGITNSGSAAGLTLVGTSYGGIFFADGTSGDEKYRGYLQYNHNHSGLTDTLLFGSGGGTYMVLDGSGNLGIGQTDPEGLLHIEKGSSGKTYAADGADQVIIENSDSMAIDIRTPSNKTGVILFSDADARGRGIIQYSHSSDNMYINTAGTQRIGIDSSGNVAIGDNHTASAKLDVLGSNSTADIGDDNTAELVASFVPNSTNARNGRLHIAGTNTPANNSIALVSDSSSNVGMALVTTGGGTRRENMIIHTHGVITKPNQCSFAAYHPAVTSSGNVVIFGTEWHDTNGDYNTSTGVFTAPVAGVYQFNVSILMSPGNNQYGRILFRVNNVGSNMEKYGDNLTYQIGQPSYFGLQNSITLKMAASDNIRIYNAGLWATYGTNYGCFSGMLIG